MTVSHTKTPRNPGAPATDGRASRRLFTGMHSWYAEAMVRILLTPQKEC